MKTYLAFLALGLLALTACNAPQGAQSKVYNDDIYYSSKDAAAEKEQRQAEEAKQTQQKAEEDKRQAEAANNANNNTQQNTADADDYYSPDNNTNANGNNSNGSANYAETPFNYDDYYDNEYAARIRRFDNPSPNYGYYDNYYTNSYFYTGNPYNYGSSIYMGYNFWGPTYTNYMYNPGFNWYSNMGWGYDPFYSPYGYNPYSSYGYGYNPYMGMGYGYNPGYYNGYNNNYFNSYDNNSYDNSYYGPRGTTSSNGRQTAQPTSLAHRYMTTVEAETNKPFDETKGRDNNPYMLHTTVSDYTTASRPVGTNTNINKPTGTINPGYTSERGGNKPVTNTGPSVESKQNNEPVYNNNNHYNRQNSSAQKQQTPHYEQQQPKYERQQPKYEQQQPHNESPKFERGSSSSPSSSPRSSSSGSGSRPRR